MISLWRKIVVNLGYVAAGLIILAALFVSLTRLMVPVLNDHKPAIEKYASQLLTKPVKIAGVNIAWNFLEPELVLQNVELIEPETNKAIMRIPLIKINLDVWRSLLSWQPILESMKIAGAHLKLFQQKSGEISLDGFSNFVVRDNATGESINANPIVAWIFSQQNLTLQDIIISYNDKNNVQQTWKIRRLSLNNDKEFHELKGRLLFLPESSTTLPTSARLNLKWKGSVTDLSNLSAHVYLYLEGVSLPQWLKNQTWQNFQILQGVGSAKIWADWSDHAWQKIQTTLQFYDLEALSTLTKKVFSISRINGNLGWERKGNQYIIAGDNLMVDLPHHLWPNSSFTFTFNQLPDNTYHIQHLNLSYLDLTDVSQWAQDSGFLATEYQTALLKLTPKGELRNLSLDINGSLDDPAHISFSTEFAGIGNQAWEKIPSLRNFQGSINWDGKQGFFKLDSVFAAFQLNQIFANQIEFSELKAAVNWQKNAEGAWVFVAKDLQANNPDLNAKVNATLTFPATGSADINLLGNFSLLNVAHVSQYLPLKLYDPELITWLRSAFLSGKTSEGLVVLQGKLSDFPFDNQTGKFSITTTAEHVELNYAPKWPMLHDVNGKLFFSGRAMKVEVKAGFIQDIPLQSVSVEIPYLGDDSPQILHVKGNVQADLAQGLRFIHTSPLEDTIGESLAELRMQGLMQLQLGLIIPLAKPDDTTVSGDVTINNAILNLPDWNLAMTNLSGKFNFTDEGISATDIVGQLFSRPIMLSLATKQLKKMRIVTADLRGSIGGEDLKSWLALPVEKFMQGTTNYQAELTLPPKDQSSEATTIIIHSDLQGIELNLPYSLGKKAEDKIDFQLGVFVNNKQPLKVKLNYEKSFSAALTLARVKQSFTIVGGDLHLGTGDANWPSQAGIIVTGNFAKLNWDIIQPYLTQFATLHKNTGKDLAQPLLDPNMIRAADIKIAALNLPGLKLNNARFQLGRNQNGYLLNMGSTEMSGTVAIPPISSKQAIVAKFDYIHLLPQSGKDGGGSKINPKSLPPITFSCDDFRYAEMNFGKMTFRLDPTNAGLNIKEFNLESASTQLHASGDWSGNGDRSSTTLEGNLVTTNLTHMLAEWNMSSSSILGSKARVDFAVNWADAPFNPSARNISGKVTLKFGQGRIINLSAETNAKMDLGRILNIFSLQSLPRHMSSEFNGLSQKGFDFDYIEGDFILQNGNAITQSIRLDGPIAGIKLAGRIGLVAKDLDLRLSVTPYVTGSLPIVAAIAVVNPIAGVATWMVDKVVGGAVSKFITYNYSITGPWNQPSWTDAGKQKAVIPSGNTSPKK